MRFVTPQQYTASNQAHFTINTAAVQEFTSVYSPLTSNNKVLDFGCGTGETTAAIGQGQLGDLGNPGYVLGVDISQDMISHCRSTYSSPNIGFQRMDVESAECQGFCSEQENSFDLVTSFSCLHWVPNQPVAVDVFHRLLKPGGKFLFVIAQTQSPKKNPMRVEYEAMKSEPKWRKLLKNTRWPHFKTVHRNNSWMTTDKDGYGEITERDFVNLLESKGIKVASSKSLPLDYKLHREFTRNFFKSSILTAFQQIQGEERKAFFNEYIARIKAKDGSAKINDDFYDSFVDGIQLVGEKK